MAGRLEGKVAFITGAARGQGRAEAVRLAEEGADVVVFDICAPLEHRPGIPPATREDLARTGARVRACGRRAVEVVGDVRRSDDLARGVAIAVDELGRIDALIANAGTSGGSALAHELRDEDWDTVIGVNLTGVWRTVKAVLPVMIDAGRGGSVVLTSSVVGSKPMRHLADYAAAKAGVLQLTRVLALENGEHGIRVNAVAPGNVATPLVMNPSIFGLFRPEVENPTIDDIEPVFAAMNKLAGKPWLDAEDVADAVLWLVSDESRYVTGTVVTVDMGLSL